jgi:dTDP-4-dehydrorhamnose reductase
MKRAILLTGKTGQIGSQLHGLLSRLGHVLAPDRRELDLAHPDSIRRVLRELRPQLIVNAAAYTAVDAAESDPSSAFAVNAEAPALLGEEAKRLNAFLVHYSTDYVFDGAKRSPYTETDPTNPLNVYGKSKFAGEQAIRDSGAVHIIFRTSWVYATRGRNFLLTILRLATERQELAVVSDQIGAPTCADDIAAATVKILARIAEPGTRPAAEHQAGGDTGSTAKYSGTYHMTAAGETTWYEFAKAILEEASRATPALPWFAAATQGRRLMAQRVVAISTLQFPSPARRPAYSVLSNSRLLETFHIGSPDWRTQLRRCFVPSGPP